MRGLWNTLFGRDRPASIPEPNPPAPMSEAALKAALARPCLPFSVGGFRPTNVPTASVFGGIRVALPDEEWPNRNGTPLLPLFQLNLTDLEYVPDALQDLAMIQLFLAQDTLNPIGQILSSTSPIPDACAVVRAYTTLDAIRPIDSPASDLKPFEIAWSAPETDYANNDVAPREIDRRANDVYGYDWAKSVYGSKLGGWPATIQSEPWWDYKQTGHAFEHVIQISPEEKSGWYCDSLFLARAIDDPSKWALDIQLL